MLAFSHNQIALLNQSVQIWGSLEFGVRLLALCRHCHPPMQTLIVISMVCCQMSHSHTLKCPRENTHFSTVRIQGSIRFIVEDSIVPVMEPQVSLNPKSVPVGLAMYFGESWMPKWLTNTKPGTQQLSPGSQDATGPSNGALPAQLYQIVSEKGDGWAHHIDIRSDL